MTNTITPWYERKLNYSLEYPREDAMQAEIVQLRAALAQPVREPLTEGYIKGLSEDIWGSELDYQHLNEIKFARAIERAQGIGGDAPK